MASTRSPRRGLLRSGTSSSGASSPPTGSQLHGRARSAVRTPTAAPAAMSAQRSPSTQLPRSRRRSRSSAARCRRPGAGLRQRAAVAGVRADRRRSPPGRRPRRAVRGGRRGSTSGRSPRETSGWLVTTTSVSPAAAKRPMASAAPTGTESSAAVRGEDTTPERSTTSFSTPSRSRKTAGSRVTHRTAVARSRGRRRSGAAAGATAPSASSGARSATPGLSHLALSSRPVSQLAVG